MSTVAIIPARGGSKGISRKNVMDFCGHPLIAWTIAAASGCPAIGGVYVSTDSDEIAAVARRYGAGVIERPAEISGDRSTSESALLHACEEIARRTACRPDRVVFLQATSPLRESVELDGALAKFEAENLDSLFAASQPEDMLFWTRSGDRLTSVNYDYTSRQRRQEMAEDAALLIETGSFYITQTNLLERTQNRLGGRMGVWPVAFWKSFEIDSLAGHELCAMLMRQHQLDRHPPVVKLQ
jgi:CMP-N,N'-diacetyllegionaminic acid synthase